MAHEVRLIMGRIVANYQYINEDGQKTEWFRPESTLDMSVILRNVLYNVQNNPNKIAVNAFVSNPHNVECSDRYGEQMFAVPIKDVQNLLKTVKSDDPRLAWAKALVNEMAKDESMSVVFYGY